jgi:hypothetical protein
MSERENQIDKSRLKPSGAARRRLMKAAGLTAIAAAVSIDWQKPAVRIGTLAAHANISAS